MNKYYCKFAHLFFCVIILSSTIDVFSDTIKTNEQHTVSLFQRVISEYSKSEGSLPTSWDQLDKSLQTSSDIDRIDKDMPGFRDKYRFLLAGDEIKFRYWSEPSGDVRVIAMGTGSMEPGRKSPPDRKVRLLLVRNENGDVFQLKPTEEQAAAVFERAGADLADYTGSGGRWQPETVRNDAPPKLNNVDGRGGFPERDNRKGTGQLDSPNTRKEDIADRNREILLGGLIVFMLLGFWMVVARFGKKGSGV